MSQLSQMITKSANPFGQVLNEAAKYSAENIFVNAILLYSITGDNRVLLFIFGLVFNGVVYRILKKGEGVNSFPSLSMQTLGFLLTFVFTTVGLNPNTINVGPLFLLIVVVFSYFVVTHSDTNFKAASMGTIVGLLLGVLYAWLVSDQMKAPEQDILVVGDQAGDYPQCEAITINDLPKQTIKERESNTEKCI